MLSIVLGPWSDQGVTPATSVTLDPWTPAANSIAVAFATSTRNAHTASVRSAPLSDDVGGTWERFAGSAETHAFGPSYGTYYEVFVCDLTADATPDERVLTLLPWNGGATGHMQVVTWSITGDNLELVEASANTVSIGTNVKDLSISPGVAPQPSSRCFACFGANNDSPFSAMDTAVGADAVDWGALLNLDATTYAKASVFQRTAYPGGAVYQPSVRGAGSSYVGSRGAVYFEVIEGTTPGGSPLGRFNGDNIVGARFNGKNIIGARFNGEDLTWP